MNFSALSFKSRYLPELQSVQTCVSLSAGFGKTPARGSYMFVHTFTLAGFQSEIALQSLHNEIFVFAFSTKIFLQHIN